MRHLGLTTLLAVGLLLSAGSAAWANGCPGADQSNDEACEMTPTAAATPPSDDSGVATVDANGEPIPYVEEITAPPDGTALTFDDPN